MKNKLWISITIIFMMFIYIVPVHADMGPKPSTNLNISGVEGKKYYVTLLSKEKESGPHRVYDENNQTTSFKETSDVDIWEKFVKYQDKDNYYFLQFFKECTSSSKFSWTYFPPEDFKILLYFPDTDSFIVSDEIYQKVGFDSYYQVEISEVGTLNASLQVSQDILQTYKMQSMFIRMLITVIVELVIALGYHFLAKKQIAVIIGTNILTQILLNFFLNIFAASNFISIGYVFIEIWIVYIEFKVYKRYLADRDKLISKKRIIGYAIFANLVSFIIGLVLNV